MELKILKVHGSKNHFYLIDIDDESQIEWAHFAKWICDPSNEGGVDGILVVCPSNKADAKMRVFNADGSEASMCGNGLRCVARYVCEKLGVERAKVETMKVTLNVEKSAPLVGELPTFAVEIAPISFTLSDLPLHYHDQKEIQHEIIDLFSPTIRFTAVAVPNPHLIGVVNKHYISHSSHQFLLAEYLNNNGNEFCPDGINLSYLYPLDDSTIYVRTFERGVGFTNACGTAMTASALVAKMNSIVTAEEITVYNPGGFVRCNVQNIDGEWKLQLVGNATFVSTHILEINGREYALSTDKITDENLQYDECMKPLDITKEFETMI